MPTPSNENEKIAAKKTRASKPKVRTGCQTCKIRRVKCGEEKPSCLRCIRSGYKCDGYHYSSSTKTPHTKLPRLLIPKTKKHPMGSNRSPSNSAIATSEFLSACNGLPWPKLDIVSAFTPDSSSSSSSGEYHQAFTSFSKLSLTSPFLYKNSDNWEITLQNKKTSPTTCGTSPSPLSSITNSPHIFSSSHDSCPKKEHDNCEPGELSSHFKYVETTCLIYRDVDDIRQNIHCTFFTCLLFQVFEKFDPCHDDQNFDDQGPTFGQVTAGLKQIREWVLGSGHDDQSTLDSRCPLQNLQPAARNSLSIQNTEALLQKLEIQVANIAETRARNKYEMFWQRSQEAVQSIPQLWPNLDDARISLVGIIERNMHWLWSIMYLSFFRESTCISIPLSPLCTSRVPKSAHQDVFLNLPPKASERVQILHEHSSWNIAFQPLLNASRMSSVAQSRFLMASVLRMHWLASWIVCADESIGVESVKVSSGVGRWLIELSELSGIAALLLKEWLRYQYHRTANECGNADDKLNQEDVGHENKDLISFWIFNLPFLIPLMTIAWIYRHRTLRTLTTKLLHCCPPKSASKRAEHENSGKKKVHGQIMAKVLAWLASVEEESCQLGATTSAPSATTHQSDLTDKVNSELMSTESDFSETSSAKMRSGLSSGEHQTGPDYIPEWAVVRRVSISYDREGKGLRVGCYQALGYLGRAMGQWRDVLISWE